MTGGGLLNIKNQTNSTLISTPNVTVTGLSAHANLPSILKAAP